MPARHLKIKFISKYLSFNGTIVAYLLLPTSKQTFKHTYKQTTKAKHSSIHLLKVSTYLTERPSEQPSIKTKENIWESIYNTTTTTATTIFVAEEIFWVDCAIVYESLCVCVEKWRTHSHVFEEKVSVCLAVYLPPPSLVFEVIDKPSVYLPSKRVRRAVLCYRRHDE